MGDCVCGCSSGFNRVAVAASITFLRPACGLVRLSQGLQGKILCNYVVSNFQLPRRPVKCCRPNLPASSCVQVELVFFFAVWSFLLLGP